MTEAIIGLIGVIIGSIITVAKEVWLDWRNRRQLARHSAILLVSTLDKYADECIEIVMDDGTYEGMSAGRTDQGEEFLVPTVDLPDVIEYPEEIIWKHLPFDITQRALFLMDRIRHINRQVEAALELAGPPDFDEVLEVRRCGYARIGLEALNLSEAIQQKYNLHKDMDNILNPEWNPKEYLEEFINNNDCNPSIQGNNF